MFGSDGAILELEPWMVTRSLTLHFKTTNEDGVMVFTGTDSDYFSIELDSGTIKFTAFKSGQVSLNHAWFESRGNVYNSRDTVRTRYVFLFTHDKIN